MVDNAITDLLGVESAASPTSRLERKRKQAHWEGVQGQVTQVRRQGLHGAWASCKGGQLPACKPP